jgi:hypothetical protein
MKKERGRMKRIFMTVFCLFAASGVLFSIYAENMFSVKIGTTWPQALLSTGICSGDAALQYGIIIDKKIAFGLTGDFLWNTKSKDVKDPSTGQYRIVSADKSFMFPILGFIMIDPVPNLIVHPSAQFQIGFNSMYSITTGQNIDTTKIPHDTTTTSHSDYYYGLIMKAIIDANYNLGENSTIFLGVEYQWAGTKTNSNTNGLFSKRDMSGIGLRAGFRVAF